MKKILVAALPFLPAFCLLSQQVPVIVTQPASQMIPAGRSVTFSVGVAAAGPFTCQWRLNGTNLANYGFITTVAGTGTGGYSGDGGAATDARLTVPAGVACDAFGNLFIADTYNNRVRVVGTNGIINTVAGNGFGATNSGAYSGNNVAATNAEFYYPNEVSLDSAGNLFIADEYNQRIREVGTNGIITTVVGNGFPGFHGDGGPALNANFNYPNDVVVDRYGAIFIADYNNFRIRKVGTNGIINTVAGNGAIGYSGDGGAATAAKLGQPTGVAVDNAGNLFIADYDNHAVRKVGTNGIITAFAGSGTAGYSGDGGPATNAYLTKPNSLALDVFGTLFIAELGRVRMVGTTGNITTIAGDGVTGSTGDGGLACAASLGALLAVAVDGSGNLFIATYGQDRIREVPNLGPTIALAAAGAGDAGNYDVVVANAYGSVTSSIASLTVWSPPGITRQPRDQTVPPGGSAAFSAVVTGTMPLAYQWYFDGAVLADQTNNVLDFTSTTLANTGLYHLVVTNLYGSATSSVADLEFPLPPVITAQPAGQSVIPGANAALSVTASGAGPLTYQWQLDGTNLPLGVITTVAGNGTPGFFGDGGAATNANLSKPVSVAVDSQGSIYVADDNNGRIRRAGPDGIITTVAGTGTNGYSGDGSWATNAQLRSPSMITVDGAGNLFITDFASHRVRRVGTNGIITTVAGTGTAGFSGDGGPASSAAVELGPLSGVAADNFGNLFIADTFNQRVRRMGPDGLIFTVAGNGAAGFAGDGGAATNAELNNPDGLRVDDSGNLFIADSANQRIRRVGTNGIITTVAGNGAAGYSGDGGIATNSSLNSPLDVAVDRFGDLFVADANNNRIRRVGTDGIMTTVVGNGTGFYSGDAGAPITAAINSPSGVAMDGTGNLFIADTSNQRIREVVNSGAILPLTMVGINNTGNYDVVVSNPYGSVTSGIVAITIAGPPAFARQPPAQAILLVGATTNFSVSAVGTTPLAYQWYFDGIALTGQTNDNLELTDVELVGTGIYNAVVTNLYGSATSGVVALTVGYAPTITTQPASQSTLAGSTATIAAGVSGTGPLFYQWQFNGTNLTGIINTVAGTGSSGSSGDGGPATNASLNGPDSVAFDGAGNLFIDTFGKVRKLGTDGIISTVAGTGAFGYSGDGGPATNASLHNSGQIAVDGFGNLFISDFYNHRVRRVDTNGIIITVAGNGTPGFSGDGGAATNAELYYPTAAAVDGFGNLYIADNENERIRKVGPDGVITTVAGNGSRSYSGDGGPAAAASISNPFGLAVDGIGNLYIADYGNARIRRVGTDGTITTVAGSGRYGFSGDGGAATNADLADPNQVTLDAFGNLFIVDSNNARIRKVDTSGTITTIAGNGYGAPANEIFSGDGGPAIEAGLDSPFGVVVDRLGNVFIADDGSDRVREVFAQGPTLVFTNVTFNYSGNYRLVVTSPFGSVTSSVVTLTITLPPLHAVAGNGGLALQLAGVAAGQTLILQAAPNLAPPVNWQPVFTNAADASGNWSFTNANVRANPAVYYRVTTP